MSRCREVHANISSPGRESNRMKTITAMERESFCHLVPHAGRMLLIDRVISWDDQSLRASCRSHASVDNPLRQGGRLSAVHALEYGAQAMAVHGGLLAERFGEPVIDGFLAGSRNLRLFRPRLDDLSGDLDVEVRMQHVQEGSLVYTFRVSTCGQPVAEGMAFVMRAASGAPAQTDA